MKTKFKQSALIGCIVFSIFCTMELNAQVSPKTTLAVVHVDTRGTIADYTTATNLFALEFEKTSQFDVLDKYEVIEGLKKNKINALECYSRECLFNAGKTLNVQKVVSASIEKFGEKIIVSTRLYDVGSGKIEKSDLTEFLNLQSELQSMVRISVQKLLGLPTDAKVVDMLVNYEKPIESPKTSLKLNGPRMGLAYIGGDNGKRMNDPLSTGGLDIMPVISQFGWQKEYQYMSSGNFQALIETVVMIGGLESGKFMPSVSFMNGFRNSKSGWEFAIGPSFRLIRRAEGFYDTQGIIGNSEQWHLQSDWYAATHDSIKNPYPIVSRIDTRGTLGISTSVIFAVGKTFKSGYLNIPVNVYCSPRKDGWVFGASFGFNILKKSATSY